MSSPTQKISTVTKRRMPCLARGASDPVFSGKLIPPSSSLISRPSVAIKTPLQWYSPRNRNCFFVSLSSLCGIFFWFLSKVVLWFCSKHAPYRSNYYLWPIHSVWFKRINCKNKLDSERLPITWSDFLSLWPLWLYSRLTWHGCSVVSVPVFYLHSWICWRR